MAEKEFYSIKEVSQMLEIPAYVLRYWEKEFPMLRPHRNRLGRRFYTKKDIEIVRMIKVILYEQGYTISGARKKLASITQGPEQLTLPLSDALKIIKEVKEELKKIRSLLD
ncbi:MAG: MerR family transcriptional regulator [candidate division WOR-3 bacterium]|nr:MerR family transcriptional regulator [candidate division WOR-3 bacterium]